MQPNTTQQGQSWGQIAAARGVTLEWLQLVADGSLEDPAFVAAIRDAAKTPSLWDDLVCPAAKELLFIPTIRIESIGGTLDDLLGMLLESIETLASPRNRNFAATTTALAQVTRAINDEIEIRRDAAATEAPQLKANVQKLEAVTQQLEAAAQKRKRSGVVGLSKSREKRTRRAVKWQTKAKQAAARLGDERTIADKAAILHRRREFSKRSVRNLRRVLAK